MADFKGWILAHRRWRQRLEDYVEGRSGEELVVAEVARDDRCTLGRWIGENRAALSSDPEFLGLIERHAEFHREAAAVLAAAQNGDRDAARRMLRPGSTYVEASGRVILAIQSVCARHCNDAENAA